MAILLVGLVDETLDDIGGCKTPVNESFEQGELQD